MATERYLHTVVALRGRAAMAAIDGWAGLRTRFGVCREPPVKDQSVQSVQSVEAGATCQIPFGQWPVGLPSARASPGRDPARELAGRAADASADAA